GFHLLAPRRRIPCGHVGALTMKLDPSLRVDLSFYGSPLASAVAPGRPFFCAMLISSASLRPPDSLSTRQASWTNPALTAVPGRAMCGRLRVGKGNLHVGGLGRCSHVFGL